MAVLSDDPVFFSGSANTLQLDHVILLFTLQFYLQKLL